MSEELLKTIIRFFAAIASNSGGEDNRERIHEFLLVHVQEQESTYFLRLFDEYQENATTGSGSKNAIDQVAGKVNVSLTYQQKMVLLLTIINLIDPDGLLTSEENDQVHLIAGALNIEKNNVDALIDFVVGGDAEELSNSNVLIVDNGAEGHQLAGPRIIQNQLTGLLAILKLPESDIYFIKYLGISTLYLNSIALKSRKIQMLPAGSTIRGKRTESIYYSEIVSKFLTASAANTITFNASSIHYKFKSGKTGLQDVSISEKGGKLIGLMGASGSGKSTLLNVLNGSLEPWKGSVEINGIDIHKSPHEVSGTIGYIPQDDLLIEELSVYENLYYAAKLCFGDTSDQEIDALVNRTLSSLGLIEIKELRVGSVLDKTISGGQRKRVNIGLELLREPAVLFVDEPTSGLSSRDSENIMDLFKELSLRGKMIFVVIHQPSSDIYKMFDTLTILDVGGHQIYYGNPIKAVSYFQQIVDATGKNKGECPVCGNVNPEQIFDIIETRVVNEYGRLTGRRRISPTEWNEFFKDRIEMPEVHESMDSIPDSQRLPNWLNQLILFFRRDVVTKLSNRQYLTINLLEAPVLAFFIAYLVKYYAVLNVESPEYTFYQNDNIPVFYFMSVVVVLFFGLIVSAEEIFRDRKILKREQYLHLSRGSYLGAKVMVLFNISAIQTLLFYLVGNLVLEIPLTEFRFWIILFSCACFANMLGLNISATFNSAVTIYIIIPILLIPQLLLSGVVVSFDKFNPSMGGYEKVPVIGELMASRWAFEAFMVSQFKDNPVEQSVYDFEQEMANMQYRKVYYVPQLESKLSFCFYEKEWDTPGKGMTDALMLLGNEIEREMNRIGANQFEYVEELKRGQFNQEIYKATGELLNKLKGYYLQRMQVASNKKDSVMNTWTGTSEGIEHYLKYRNRYQNEMVASIVKNMNSVDRIVEIDGALQQRIYPVFIDDHRPNHFFDFRGIFYLPTKYFMGLTFDTLYFNLAVIWIMTMLLYLTLYFDVFKRGLRKLSGG